MDLIKNITDNDRLKSSPSLGRSFFQPKLAINEPGDSYEQEADAMAGRVMRMADTQHNENAFFKPAVSHLQRKCHHCEEDEKLHRKESTDGDVQGSNNLDSYVSSLSSQGQPLPETSRKFFEPRFGHDFSNVRIHNDSVAAKSTQSINALAYTTGNNIVFNKEQYSPESDSGKKLMAHELTHVVQQKILKSDVVQKQENKKDQSVPPFFGLQIAPKAYTGIEIEYLVENLPYSEFTNNGKYSIKKTPYYIVPNLIHGLNNLPEIVFYIAYRIDKKRNDYIIGPDSIVKFLDHINDYVHQANGAYAFEPNAYSIPGNRMMKHIMEGNLTQAFYAWGEMWGIAQTDKHYYIGLFFSTVLGAAGAAEPTPAPEVGVPGWAPRIVQGGKNALATEPPPLPIPRASQAPSFSGSRALAQEPLIAPQVEPISEPFVEPAPNLVSLPINAKPVAPFNLAAHAIAAAGSLGIEAGIRHQARKNSNNEKKEKNKCKSNEPSPESLPISWPKELPLPEEAEGHFTRKSTAMREWEGIERGEYQRELSDAIKKAKSKGQPIPHACSEDDRYQEYDAHHKHPLYLGGDEAEFNLCALETKEHHYGHKLLNNQSEWLDTYMNFGICSPFLNKHPDGQTYVIVHKL